MASLKRLRKAARGRGEAWAGLMRDAANEIEDLRAKLTQKDEDLSAMRKQLAEQVAKLAAAEEDIDWLHAWFVTRIRCERRAMSFDDWPGGAWR